MPLDRKVLEDRLAAMRAGLQGIREDLARQDGAIQALEWVLEQLDAQPPEPTAEPDD